MLILIITNAAQSKAAAVCRPDRIDATAVVRHVADGDTIILEDERHVRIIGMNTPEVGYRNKASEPFADAARLRLIQLLSKHDNLVKLRYGKDKFDRHGRLLAHVFPGDDNVTEFMLRQGLAAQITVPPNLWKSECYRRAEDEARFKNRRIWRLPFYQYPNAKKIKKGGFNMVQGDITRVVVRGKKWRLEMGKNLTLSIGKKYRRYFNKKKLTPLLGKRVFIRGWFRKRKNRFYIGLKHPEMLKVYPVACPRITCRADQARLFGE